MCSRAISSSHVRTPARSGSRWIMPSSSTRPVPPHKSCTAAISPRLRFHRTPHGSRPRPAFQGHSSASDLPQTLRAARKPRLERSSVVHGLVEVVDLLWAESVVAENNPQLPAHPRILSERILHFCALSSEKLPGHQARGFDWKSCAPISPHSRRRRPSAPARLRASSGSPS
jgi:hypothetical protein